MPVRRVVVALLILPLLVAVPAAATPPQKAPLTHDVYDGWRSIVGAELSRDGEWLLYGDVPQRGDAELVVRHLVDGRERRAPLGWLNPGTEPASLEAEFTADGSHVVFLASPAIADVKAARKDEKNDEEMPKKRLGILRLDDGSLEWVERVQSFALPAEASGHVAYRLEKPVPVEEEPGAEAAEAAAEAPEEEKDKKKETFGTDLVLRTLADGSGVSVSEVLEYTFTDNGARLFVTVASDQTPETDGVYAVDAASGAISALLTGEGNYEHLAIDEEQTRVAFVTDRDDWDSEKSAFALYGMAVDAAAVELWVSHGVTTGFPDGMAVSDKEPLRFSDDGSLVMFGIAPLPEPEAEDDEAADDRAKFDLWHWQDPYPQPQQLEMAEEVRDEAFESVWHVEAQRFVQLADADLPDLQISDNGAMALGTSDRAWSRRHYEGSFDDVFIVDPRDGARSMIAERASWGAQLSPRGGYVAWFGGTGDWIGYDSEGGGGFAGGQDWYLYDVSSGERRNLTAGLDVSFEMQDWDTPNLAAPYGRPTFTEDDSAVLISDEFDIWVFPTAGGEPRRLTEGVGRELQRSFSWERLDPEADGAPAAGPVLLSSVDSETMATGFWVDRVDGNGAPRQLLAADANLRFAAMARDADTVIFTRQTFAEFPDVWAARLDLQGGAFADARKVTDLGSQTEPYAWGQAKLVPFRSLDGKPLKGILVTPEDFDPSRKYPLMVYIYETLHQGLHNFRAPAPGTSINPSYYVSNGYVLWMPDIEYDTGYPGKDALKCVLPGISMLVNEGFVDPDAIGIQGHSWGGYQISYMLTQTNVFAAAEAGAPVSNMTSAYGGIRWGSGLVRQFQYERTQSRLGASLWEVPLRYVENSPLFWADKIQTPLLMLHNDQDDAVPWYQGIEFIMALRRLDKEAYMFNYNGEPHGLRQRVNQQDWTVRMQQFFDHHLKGAPAPAWMAEGIRGWEKGEVDR